VVSVGNLTVGGTGKTPTTIWLAQELQKRGIRVAILSRGYKRKSVIPLVLEPGIGRIDSSSFAEGVLDAGDEPLMMARIFRQTVGVGKRRFEVAQEVLKKSDVDVFILDDGYQHLQLRRDVDLLLLGSDTKGWVLPAGPFREPRGAMKRADLYLVTGSAETWKSLLSSGDGSQSFFGSLQGKSLVGYESNEWKEHPLSLLDRSKVLAVSAVADATSFYRMIHDWEAEIVDALEFPDHHNYTSNDWQRINRAARNVDLIVTTEKDILKLTRFPFARDKLLALRVAMVIENEEALIGAVTRAIQPRRSEA
jgi:tetraacyldisaccharide 4'-kinase